MKSAPAECADAVNADSGAAILDRVRNVVTVERGLFKKPEASLRQIVGPGMNVEVFEVGFASGLDQDRVRPGRGQFFDHKSASGARADDAYVVDFLLGNLHERFSNRFYFC